VEPSLAVFDTNILIDHLRGIEQARAEIQSYRIRTISLITWIEILVGSPAEHEAALREFLDDFVLLPVSTDVAERAVHLRRDRKLKLPDAIILATAINAGGLLVTRNTRDFPAEPTLIRNPYSL
jgi:predicted nucleic acid-binding protein